MSTHSKHSFAYLTKPRVNGKFVKPDDTLCDCGQPGIWIDKWHAYVCEKCNKLDSTRRQRNKQSPNRQLYSPYVKYYEKVLNV